MRSFNLWFRAAFKAEYHKLYFSPEEELKRYKFFETNLANADAWNDEQVCVACV